MGYNNFGFNNGALALGFMSNNFKQASAFDYASYIGSQRMLSNQISPLISASAKLTNTVASQIPIEINNNYQLQSSIISHEFSPDYLAYKTSQDMLEYQLQSQAIKANKDVNIAASNANASSGSSYLCTALIAHEGKDSDCYDMRIMDKYMRTYMMDNHKRDLARYYREAPDLIDKVKRDMRKTLIFHTVRQMYINPFIRFIERGENEMALKIYKQCLQYCGAMVGMDIYV